jgi:hypothetical protein
MHAPEVDRMNVLREGEAAEAAAGPHPLEPFDNLSVEFEVLGNAGMDVQINPVQVPILLFPARPSYRMSG